MTRIDRVLKKLSELYEFNRKLKAYKIKKEAGKSLKEEAAKDRRALRLPVIRRVQGIGKTVDPDETEEKTCIRGDKP
jgi:hypothetical protein